jgi:DNA-binding NtrC family response regulator
MHNKTIKTIIVDNNSLEANQLKQQLINANFSCAIYSSYRQAIKILESDHTIDLVISDLFAGNNYGILLARTIKNNPRLKYIPVVIVSDNWDNNTIIECAKAGVNALIAKPYTTEDILTKIGDALANGKRKVLIIDDDAEILNLLRQVIELERFEVITGETAEKGIQLLAENKIDAVVSDILLPGMSGVDFMKLCKSDYPHIPAILITGYAGHFDAKAAYDTGADGFFQKPFNNIELVRRLRDVVDRKAKVLSNS